nr:ribonuclease H-like domain-containing protein [Tanacetum cinerariifolium]
MTRNISYLSEYEPYDGGYVSFGHGGGKITGKGIIKTGKIEFENGKDFKLNDDTDVLLRTPKQHNMYSIDLNNIVPHKNLTCLVAKALVDESLLRLSFEELRMRLMLGPLSKKGLLKGIRREFSNARTPQQNGVAERRNRTLIEAARTMLADAKLPRTKKVEENLHVDFLENKLIEKGAGLNWLFDIDTLSNSMNHVPVVVARISSINISG